MPDASDSPALRVENGALVHPFFRPRSSAIRGDVVDATSGSSDGAVPTQPMNPIAPSTASGFRAPIVLFLVLPMVLSCARSRAQAQRGSPGKIVARDCDADFERGLDVMGHAARRWPVPTCRGRHRPPRPWVLPPGARQ